MFLYARRYVDPAALLEAAADPEVLRSAAASQLPEAIEAELAFTYFRGRTFVTALRRLSGRWNLVDIAFRSRPPVSSEQILHPYKYLTYERPLPVRLGVGETLDKPWRRFGGGVFGEFDTFQLLRLGNGERTARRAAAGWGGQRSLLWRRGRAPCAGACRSRNALVAAWRWDSRADRRQFERALRGYLEQGLSAQRMGPRLWSLRGGSIALAGRGAGTGLAFAPRARLARRLAGR